jgi:hypothetical protein
VATVKIMRILRATAMMISIGFGTAYAGDGDGQAVNTQFTIIQDQQQATIQARRQAAGHAGGVAVQASDTRSQALHWHSVFSLP